MQSTGQASTQGAGHFTEIRAMPVLRAVRLSQFEAKSRSHSFRNSLLRLQLCQYFPLRDRRTSLSESRWLFKCVRKLQDTEILLIAADNLHANRKAFARKSRRHGGCRVSRGRDVPAGLHPVDVIAKVDAGDLRWIGRVDVERRQLRGWEDEVFILLKESLKAAPEEGMGNLGAGDVLTGELHPCLDFVFEGVFEGLRVLLEHRAIV